MDTAELLKQRKRTRAIAELFSHELHGYLQAAAPLINPRTVFGEHIHGAPRGASAQGGKALSALRSAYEGLRNGQPFNLRQHFDTPIEHAADDYLLCLEKVYPYADYITVNISSPNTQNLRDLQGEDALDRLLGALSGRREELADETGRRVPMALKVAPDLEEGAVPAIADVVAHHGMDAVIATNTTIDRSAVAGMKHAGEGGGLSGAPLKERADRVLGELRRALPAEIAMIGVGGITRGEDAVDKLKLGADLVQFYTGMVYRGPELVGECLRAIADWRAE